jgi:hypothetical protein
MKNPVLLLKFSFIIGAILDALVAIQMFSPDILTLTTGVNSFAPTSNFLYASYMSGIMMISWSVLLIWGYVKPVQRKDVLLITVLPVIGLMISGALSTTAGFLPWLTTIIYLAIEAFLVILFTVSYLLNRKTE